MALQRAIALTLALLLCLPAHAGRHRDAHARAEFMREHPCPSTGKTKGPCPGWVIDHRQAICVGGADAPSNMAWQTVEDAKAKDRWECKPGWEERVSTP